MTVLSCYFFTGNMAFLYIGFKDHVASALEAVLHGFLLWERKNVCYLHRVKEDGS